jgi:hypothetical protein
MSSSVMKPPPASTSPAHRRHTAATFRAGMVSFGSAPRRPAAGALDCTRREQPQWQDRQSARYCPAPIPMSRVTAQACSRSRDHCHSGGSLTSRSRRASQHWRTGSAQARRANCTSGTADCAGRSSTIPAQARAGSRSAWHGDRCARYCACGWTSTTGPHRPRLSNSFPAGASGPPQHTSAQAISYLTRWPALCHDRRLQRMPSEVEGWG